MIGVFIRELSHSRMFTNEAHWKRGLTLSGECGNCQGTMKCCLHIVRDCNEAIKVWENLLLPSMSQKFFSLPFSKWLEWNLVGDELTVFRKKLGGNNGYLLLVAMKAEK